MEIQVGVRDVPREVIVESNESAAAVEAALSEAIASQGLWTLTDDKGRKVFVPAGQIAYVELGSEHARTVGFGAVTK